MYTERAETEFRPLNIVLETKEEVRQLHAALEILFSTNLALEENELLANIQAELDFVLEEGEAGEFVSDLDDQFEEID